MPTAIKVPKIDVTTDYDSFVLLGNNRIVTEGHVNNLKKEFEDKGNITASLPIIVNDRMEIIDGQHRLQAAKELKLPVYYRVVPGISIEDARHMNILHRVWTTDDYARSYANSGNKEYQKYLNLREEFGFTHTVTLIFIDGYERKNLFREFRNGDLVIKDEPAARHRLETLLEVMALVPRARVEHLGRALLMIMRGEHYDHNRMLRKLEERGDQLIRRFGSTEEYLRALEDVYNYGYQTRTRLY